MIITHQIRRESWVVGGFGLLLFTLGFWQQPFIDFETRFALFAQEMLRHGPALFPTTYGEPYPDYPVASTLLIWLCSLPFGAVTKLSAILPTALFSAATLVLLYRLLAPHSRSWAVLAISLQLMTATFLAQARSISLDQIVATITLLAFYLVYRVDIEKRAQLTRWLPLLLLAGFIVRGPLGLVIPAGVVIGYYALIGQWRELLRFGALAVLLLIAAWGAQLALATHFYGADFMHEVVRMQVVGRLESSTKPRFWYYFTSSIGNFALAYPLALLVAAISLPTLLRQPRTAQTKLLLGLMIWTLVVLVGLSIPHTKKSRYLLPMVPAVAALAAALWTLQQPKLLAWLGAVLEKLFMVLPTLLVIALLVGRHKLQRHAIELPLPWLYAALALCQCAVVAVVLRKIQITTLTGLSQPALVSVLAALAVWCVNLLAVEPVVQQTKDTAGFVQQLEALRRAQPAPLAMTGIFKDGPAIKYMVNVDYDLRPIFICTGPECDSADLRALDEPIYLMSADRDLPNLPALPLVEKKIVLQGRFDNRNYSVLLLIPLASQSRYVTFD